MLLLFLSQILAELTGTDAFKQNGCSQAPFSKPYDQHFTDRYSPLKFMANLGPYSSRSGVGISTETPPNCEVDQVVLLQRHGERYPDKHYVIRHRQTLMKIQKQHSGVFTGDLQFLNDWQYFVESDGDIGLELTKGPYSGLADLFEKGSIFRSRYGHLWDGHSRVPLFVGAVQRIIQSARAFGQGLFGYNYTDIAEVNFIPEDDSTGANAITPFYCAEKPLTRCLFKEPISRDSTNYVILPQFDVAAARLNTEHGLDLTGADISNLLEIGAFDLAVNGNTPWLDVFTQEEWIAYNYRKSLFFHCFHGTASKRAQALGTNWANATTKVLNQGPIKSGLPFVLNFGHDTDITAFLGGMGILKPLRPLRVDQIVFDTRYDASDIVPMGAQLIIERLKCTPSSDTQAAGSNGSSSTYSADSNKSLFVRLLLNEAVVPLDTCYDGPGFSCALDQWTQYVEKQTEKYNYQEICQPRLAGYPEYLDYYWNYNHTTANNTAKHVPWQGSPLV